MVTMRTLVVACAVALTAGAAVRADDRDRALAIVERGIRAHGGAAALTKAQTASRSASGTQFQAGENVPFTSEAIVRLPDRFRVTAELDKRFRFVLVVNGMRGWLLEGGAAKDLGKDRVKELREEAHVWWAATLVPLTRDGFTLATLPEARVNDRPAFVVKAAARGVPDIKLFFDKGSGLLVKIERRGTEAGIAVDKAYLYSDHKDFDGAKLPAKEVVTLNGKKWTDVTLSYKALSEVDEKLFTKP